MGNENNLLTPQQRMAMGLDPIVDETSTKKGPGRPKTKKTLVEETLSPAEKAKREMLASFGDISYDTNEVFANDKPAKLEKQEIDLDDLLSNLSIDVNKVEILDKPTVSVTDSSIVINGRPTFETICNQSGYTAYVQSLKYSDLSSLENSVGGFYAGKQRLYKTIFDKINTTSVGKVDFETFLKMTSLYDVPSLIYGIYCQTFKTEVEFTVTCPHCKEEMNIKVPNQGLISVKNEETYKNIETILGSLSTPDEVMNNSLLNNRIKLILPTSKMMVEIKIPSLYKYLDTIGSVKPEKFEELQDILGMMVFVDKVYKLDIANLVKNKKVSYYEVKSKKEIAEIIAQLEIADSKEIQKIIESETEKYAIQYSIKGMPCRKCTKDIDDIPVDMEELTFFRLRQM